MSAPFKPVDWSKDTNIYEVNLRQYTKKGSFQAFEKELPRLREMGIEVLWFMPVTPISEKMRQGSLGSYYACSDYTSTNAEFGSIEDFKHLVDKAHSLQFKVIIDWVANHTGWDHLWTWQHPEFYRRNHEGNFYDAHGWIDVIDLNYDNEELRMAMLDAMKFWVVECGIDGFRCDMAMLVPLDFWRMAREELDKIRKLFWLAECEEINYHEVFDATYSWKLLHTMEAFWRNETGIQGLYEVLEHYHSGFPPAAMHALFTTNHDENSHSGSEYARMGSAANIFAILCCTWNGIPLIYSGQEMPNTKSLKFFDKDPIEWTGNYELHDFFKKLLALRKTNKAMQVTADKVQRLYTNDDRCLFSFLRKNESDEVLVIMNLSHEEKHTAHIQYNPGQQYTNIFTGELTEPTDNSSFHMQPWTALVLEKTSS